MQTSRTINCNQSGFSLVELLVVVSLIGIFASLVLVLFTSARNKAQIVRTKEDLRALQSVVVLLQHDTKKWPNGCVPEASTNPVINLSTPRAGLTQKPPAEIQGDACWWSNEDVARWSGPYVSSTIDPWGVPYVLSPHYTPYESCVDESKRSTEAALVSSGENKQFGDCDDLFVPVQ